MPHKVTFRISAAAAPYVGADKPRELRLQAAAGQVKLPALDLVLLVYYLCHDSDQEVKQTAVGTLRRLDPGFIAKMLSNPELHPRIIDVLVQLHFRNPALAPLFAAHPMLSEKSLQLLVKEGMIPAAQQAPAEVETPQRQQAPAEQEPAPLELAEELVEEDDESTDAGAEAGGTANGAESEAGGESGTGAESDEPVDEESEEFQSKYQMAQNMGVADKIKMAMTGDKEWRGILIKDSNKLVSGAAIKNPRMTEAEVLAIAKSQVQNDEIMRVICANKDWIKNPQIRKALVENHKTPLPAALRFVGTLSEKDLSQLARSKNISTVIATQARRILLAKKK